MHAGSGQLAPSKASLVRAQILGFVIFADPTNVRALVAAFGSDRETVVPEEEWHALLPGPHPVLRSMLGISAGIAHLHCLPAALVSGIKVWDDMSVSAVVSMRLCWHKNCSFYYCETHVRQHGRW